MKIVLDARWIFSRISGIGNYTRHLIQHLAVQDRRNSYVLLFRDPDLRDRTIEEAHLASAPNFSTALVPYGVFSPANQLLLPLWLRRQACRVYHSPNYMIPLLAFPRWRRGPVRCVVTIHDMIPFLFPRAAPRSRKARLFALYRFVMQEVAARSDVILTDSQSASRDVLQSLHIPERHARKVQTVYCGVSDRFCPGPLQSPPAADRPARLLYVGRADPYKNVTGLVRIVDKARRLCPVPIELRIAGEPDPRYPEAGDLVRQLGLQSVVRWTGYLSDDDLLRTYQESDLLVHPSRYEGFGLQIAEAMASGVPVVSSNAASLPEVAGDAALTLAPDDEDGFAAAIRTVLSDRRQWESMRARGIEQARRFSWARTALEVLAAYEAVAEDAP